jgi:hypothetical protein
MDTREAGRELWLNHLDEVLDELGFSIADGLVKGLEQSKLIKQLLEVIASLQQRMARLEQQQSLQSRGERTERDLTPKGEATSLEPPPPPRSSSGPLHPPANLPQNPATSNVPFGLSAGPAKRTTIRRPRSKTPSKPTVVYRSDPRASAKSGQEPPPHPFARQKSTGSVASPADPFSFSSKNLHLSGSRQTSSPYNYRSEAINPYAQSGKPITIESVFGEESSDETCAEPGCHRPVRCRGLCSLHYQRVRYKERKIEHKQANDDPLPPPPPVKHQQPLSKDSDGTRGVFALLYEEKGRRILAGLINQMKFDRVDLVERMNQQFSGMPGVPLNEEDVLRSIHYHKLGDALKKREGEIILRHLNKQRGSLAKTAQKMKIDQELLKGRVDELSLQDEVAQVRNSFREEILEQVAFAERLDLALTKEKYLKDLDIEEEVDTSLQTEIQEQLTKLPPVSEVSEIDEVIQRALSLDEQHYRRMIRRYHLEEKLESIIKAQ